MKNKKLSKEAILIALTALLILPVQQIIIRQMHKHIKVEKRTGFALEENWSECALSGNAAGVILMANSNFRRGHADAAEKWLYFGCMELQAPSVMLYYGDYLMLKNRKHQAVYWYRLALKKALMEKSPANFVSEVQKRLENNNK